MNKVIPSLNSILAILVAMVQISCTNETAEQTRNRYQREYEKNFKTTICIVMEVYVERYQKDPFKNTFGIQGYATYEDVLEMLVEHSRSLMKEGIYAYDYPKDFVPNPVFPPEKSIQNACPNTFELFWQIPI